MVEGGLKTLLISFLLMGLFLFAMTTFAIQISTINPNANSTIANIDVINYTYNNLSIELRDVEQDANSSKATTEEDTRIEGLGDIFFNSIFDFRKSVATTLSVFYDVFIRLPLITIFGGSSTGNPFVVITSTLAAILMFTIVFLSWRLIKTGS